MEKNSPKRVRESTNKKEKQKQLLLQGDMKKNCFHCGDDVPTSKYKVEDKLFCCNGCKTVYLLLSDNNLEEFYHIEQKPGVRPEKKRVHQFDFLDVPEIQKKFITFEDEKSIHTTLHLPQIHCSSCVYLLENITKLNENILSCQTNFARREANIIFDKKALKFSEVAILLEKIGYTPNFESRKDSQRKLDRAFLYKLGVAGFAFGSIMLWSFPEYLGIEKMHYEYRSFMAYLSFAVSIPVLLYSAKDYLTSAYKAVKHRKINIDVPIAIGIIALYFQSCVYIFSGKGPGYMDSFSGFIFFLLIGKWFQNKTYQSLSFDRDKSAYLPVAVIRKKGSFESLVEVEKLSAKDEIILRNEEIVPCDAELLDKQAKIDYSFVTGEAIPVKIEQGQTVYAGGKVVGKRTLFQVISPTKRSQFTQLWGKTSKKNKEEQSDTLSIYFLIVLLIVAGATAVTYAFLDSSRIFSVVTSVLIVACPCALALAKPFVYGNTMRKMGRKKFFAKNTEVVEKLKDIDAVVFDKTGTLTKGSFQSVEFIGENLSKEDLHRVIVLAQNSTHPLSQSICKNFHSDFLEDMDVLNFEENEGKGVQAEIGGKKVFLGSANFVGFENKKLTNTTASHLSINGIYCGHFKFDSELREHIGKMLTTLAKHKEIHILSGDNEKDKEMLLSIDGLKTENIHFNQTPQGKFDYIKKLQSEGNNVLMVGDGLNDSGALIQSDVGMAVSENTFHFTPNSDIIADGNELVKLDDLFRFSVFARKAFQACLLFSVFYNLVGLSFAITDNLTPLVAAILMPLSSISIVGLSTFLVLSKRF